VNSHIQNKTTFAFYDVRCQVIQPSARLILYNFWAIFCD